MLSFPKASIIQVSYSHARKAFVLELSNKTFLTLTRKELLTLLSAMRQ